MYYIAIIELAKKWVDNNGGQVDFKAVLDEKFKIGGIGFRGELRKSSVVNDLPERGLAGIGRRKKRGGG